MSIFTYVLSSRIYERNKSGISMIQVDIFAKNNEEADEILASKFDLKYWNIDDVEEQ